MKTSACPLWHSMKVGSAQGPKGIPITFSLRQCWSINMVTGRRSQPGRTGCTPGVRKQARKMLRPHATNQHLGDRIPGGCWQASWSTTGTMRLRVTVYMTRRPPSRPPSDVDCFEVEASKMARLSSPELNMQILMRSVEREPKNMGTWRHFKSQPKKQTILSGSGEAMLPSEQILGWLSGNTRAFTGPRLGGKGIPGRQNSVPQTRGTSEPEMLGEAAQ